MLRWFVLAAWWPVLLLAYVPQFVTRIIRIVIGLAFLRLDRSHPDDLPHTAGEFLGLELARLGIDDKVSVIVTDAAKVAQRVRPSPRNHPAWRRDLLQTRSGSSGDHSRL